MRTSQIMASGRARRRVVAVAVAVGLGGACAAVATDAAATPPGRDGAIAYIAVDSSATELLTAGPEVFAVRPDGTGATNISRNCGRIIQPGFSSWFVEDLAWSPSGTELAYDLNGTITILDLASGSLTPVSSEAGTHAGLDWFPDGSRLIYTQLAPGLDGDVFTLPAAGGVATNLTPAPDELDAAGPAVSPDGSTIVFSHGRHGLFLMASDGSGVRQLTDLGTTYGSDSDPDFTPDGRAVVFTRRPNDTTADYAIYTVPAAGGTPVRITDPALHARAPSVSPSGKRIAFLADDWGDDRDGEEIWVMNAGGSNPHPIGVDAQYGHPDWGTAQSYSGGPCGDGNHGVGGPEAGPVERFGRLRASRTGISWRLGCAPGRGRCRARLVASAAPLGVVGRAQRRIGSGQRRVLSVGLSGEARRELAREGRLVLRVKAAVTQGGETATRRRSVTLGARRAR